MKWFCERDKFFVKRKGDAVYILIESAELTVVAETLNFAKESKLNLFHKWITAENIK